MNGISTSLGIGGGAIIDAVGSTGSEGFAEEAVFGGRPLFFGAFSSCASFTLATIESKGTDADFSGVLEEIHSALGASVVDFVSTESVD